MFGVRSGVGPVSKDLPTISSAITYSRKRVAALQRVTKRTMSAIAEQFGGLDLYFEEDADRIAREVDERLARFVAEMDELKQELRARPS